MSNTTRSLTRPCLWLCLQVFGATVASHTAFAQLGPPDTPEGNPQTPAKIGRQLILLTVRTVVVVAVTHGVTSCETASGACPALNSASRSGNEGQRTAPSR